MVLARGLPELSDFCREGTEREGDVRAQLLGADDPEHEGERVQHPLGHPDNPLADEVLLVKFVDCAGRAAVPIPPERARRAAAELLAIERAPSAQAVLRSALA